MSADYTVIESVRQQFGDDKLDPNETPLPWLEPDAELAGRAKDFPFSCPGIDTTQPAILQFLAIGVAGVGAKVQVNGFDIPGGISAGPVSTAVSPSRPLWSMQHLVVSGSILEDQNVLRIESLRDGDTENYEDFLVDNIVIWFKQRVRPPDAAAEGETAEAATA